MISLDSGFEVHVELENKVKRRMKQGGDGPKAQRADVPPMLMASEVTFHIRIQFKILNCPLIDMHVAYNTPL